MKNILEIITLYPLWVTSYYLSGKTIPIFGTCLKTVTKLELFNGFFFNVNLIVIIYSISKHFNS